ncbi:uncharacterized protein LOC122056526 isoform X2 [Zingiber officinale]|uniref:uncharacterized protein LOC122056526 isoform X2 n=1 Tax=Zingiber officinale TaxID=94328 RepID=UPI001C4CE24C|nr:uncharacterized protein LOC122056526 isoform X2 [Zingiber officinale]
MARLAFSRRGLHVDISRGHQIDSVGGRPSPDRRHRQTPRKGTGFRWSHLLMLGLSLVILAFFVLGAWQLSLTTGDEGPSEFPSSITGGRRRPTGSVIRFVPSDLARRFEEHRLALYRRRSESRLGLRPPRLALVIEGAYKDSDLVMLFTLVKSLMDLRYTFMVFILEDNTSQFLWQNIGWQLTFLNIENLSSVDWSNYEGVIVSSLGGRKVISRLMQEPFASVPLIWLIHEDILGERLPLYVQFGWEGLIGEWRSAFARADVVVFPDFSFPILYSLLDNGNFFVIPGYPVDVQETENYIASHSRKQLRKDFEFSESDLLILIISDYFVYDDLSWDYTAVHALSQVKKVRDLSGIIKFVLLCSNSTNAPISTIQEIASRMGFPDGSVRQYRMDQDVKCFLLMADIVLYWPFNREQSFPPLLLLAMSFEIPIVAPNFTAIEKYVVDSVHGFLFHPSRLDTLERAFSLLITDNTLSNIAHSVASHGRSLSMDMLASECISGYAELLESILHFPSDTLLPYSTSHIQQKTWWWNIERETKQNNTMVNNSSLRYERSRQISSIVYVLEEHFLMRLVDKGSQLENKTYKEDLPNQSDWIDVYEMEAIEDLESLEIQELDERMEKTSGSWEDVYRNARKSEKQKADAYERDEGELERTGQPLCIYEIYTGLGAWSFLHHGSIYRGITLVSLSHFAEKVLEKAIQEQREGDIMYYWAVMDMDKEKTNSKLNFWSMCDHLNADQCSAAFENAFRLMYGIPSGNAALPPMPLDGDHWSILHSWVMPTPSYLEFIMFTRMFVDSLDSLNQSNKSMISSCVLGSSMLEKRNCYCRVLEVLVNVWAYHSGRRMVYLDPLSGELKEQHPLELRELWVKYFNLDLLKSMDEDLAERADDGMHPHNKWLWPLTGEVHWQGILDREREDRLKQKMDKKKKTKEKLLERHKHGYKQKSLGQTKKSQ